MPTYRRPSPLSRVLPPCKVPIYTPISPHTYALVCALVSTGGTRRRRPRRLAVAAAGPRATRLPRPAGAAQRAGRARHGAPPRHRRLDAANRGTQSGQGRCGGRGSRGGVPRRCRRRHRRGAAAADRGTGGGQPLVGSPPGRVRSRYIRLPSVPSPYYLCRLRLVTHSCVAPQRGGKALLRAPPSARTPSAPCRTRSAA